MKDEHAFGAGAPLQIGLEEELLLVEAGSGRLAHVAEELLPRVGTPEGMVVHEAYASELEVRSPASASVEDAARSFSAARAAIESAGVTLIGSGIHPAGEPGDAQLVDHERYREVERSMRGLMARTPECALHVHVGLSDEETAVRAFNGVRALLPLLQGLAANSPFWFGVDSGFASARALLVRSFPGKGAPGPFDSWDQYRSAMADVLAAGQLPDYTFVWWDLRLHPRFGTLEVRELDAQSRLADAAGIAALVRALVARAADGHGDAGPPAEALDWSSFRAARDGLDATLAHDGELRPLREVAAEVLEAARPYARELGDEGALEEVERLLGEGGAPQRRRAAFAESGMPGLLGSLIEETRAPWPPA